MPSNGLSQPLSKSDFIREAENGFFMPLYKEIPYDQAFAFYPPFSGRGSLMFESVKGPLRTARYSFIAFEPYCEYTVKDGKQALNTHEGTGITEPHPAETLRKLLRSYPQLPSPDLPPFQGGAAGLISYDFLHYLERVPTTTMDDLEVPDLHFFLFDRTIAIDHKEKKAWAILCPGARNPGDSPMFQYEEAEDILNSILQRLKTGLQPDAPKPKDTFRINHDVPKAQYIEMAKKAKDYIAAGDIFQANLSLRVSAPLGDRSPWDLYLALRDINPSPFAGYLDFGDYVIASSSPERLVMVRDGRVELRPIAGTRPRGRDSDEDEKMRAELLLNVKERAEHIMLIDLERNDIGRVCDYGSVKVDELMVTEDYSHVIHIVSNVSGTIAAGRDSIDVLKATFPGGTITGVPKVRCMEIIDELETLRRGPYTGSMGYIGYNGEMDLNIIIRTFLIKNETAYVQAGAGIVADSDPEREYSESLKKAAALIGVLEDP
jgi:anthranilate/para-aminobenzoate synthase component I